MPPQWTEPLDLATLYPPPASLSSPAFDYEAQFRYPLHDVPTTASMTFRVTDAESRMHRNLNRPLHTRPTHAIPHSRPLLPRLPRLLNRSPKPRRPPPILRLNRLRPPLPSDLSRFARPVRSEFMRVSGIAARSYAPPPDPLDDHDHSLFEFPPQNNSPSQQSHPPSPIQEPRRRNIQFLIERYNTNNHSSATQSPQHPRSPASCDSSHHSPSHTVDTHAHHFDIRSVRDIFERHTQKLTEHTDISLSSVTDSASPSNISNAHLTPKSPTTTSINSDTNTKPTTPPTEDRPRRIAFADMSNTLELSPCPSSTSDSHPNDRDVPSATSPWHERSSTVLCDERENLPPPVGRKKSFAVFKPIKDGVFDRVRARSFAHGSKSSAPPAEETPQHRRFTDAERRKNQKTPKHVRSYGASVRRRFESFRNMISADDY